MNSFTTRTIKLSLNRKTIEDQIAAFLYAIGVVKDNEDVAEIKMEWSDKADVIPLELKIKKEVEVKLLKLNA